MLLHFQPLWAQECFDLIQEHHAKMSQSHSALSNLNIISRRLCVQKVLYHFQDAAAISLTWNAGFFDCLSSLITDESKLDFCTSQILSQCGRVQSMGSGCQ